MRGKFSAPPFQTSPEIFRHGRKRRIHSPNGLKPMSWSNLQCQDASKPAVPIEFVSATHRNDRHAADPLHARHDKSVKVDFGAVIRVFK